MTAPRIVLLTNDSSTLSLMHDILRPAGYRTLRCRPQDVRDVHALIKRFQPALVILDLWAARPMDGWASLQRLWADVATTHIPAIIVAATPDALPVQVKVLRGLRCQVVPKPFDRTGLLTTVAAVVCPSPAQYAQGEVR